MRPIAGVIGCAAGVLLTAGAVLAQDAGIEQGRKVFAAQKCTTCHSIAGKGNKKGALDDVGSRLSAAEIRAWLVDPEGMAKKLKPPSTRKPPMKKKELSPGDLDALVGLLTSLKKA